MVFAKGVTVVLLCATLACLWAGVTASSAKDWTLEDGFVASVVNKEAEEIIELKDADGNLVNTIHKLYTQGVQIEKPANKPVCLVRLSNQTSECYTQSVAPHPVPVEIVERCMERAVYVLDPVPCVTTPEDAPECASVGEGQLEASRKRRSAPTSRCCRYTRESSTTCVHEHCCSRFIWCTRHCCDKYRTNYYFTQHCVDGYLYKF